MPEKMGDGEGEENHCSLPGAAAPLQPSGALPGDSASYKACWCGGAQTNARRNVVTPVPGSPGNVKRLTLV